MPSSRIRGECGVFACYAREQIMLKIKIHLQEIIARSTSSSRTLGSHGVFTCHAREQIIHEINMHIIGESRYITRT